VRVLIAEDGIAARLILEQAVLSLGHECLVAADGTEAWGLFQAQGADVVISDWGMPGIDGLELCRRVRAHDSTPYTYFVFLTALEDKQHAIMGMEAGADDYLAKPLDLDELQLGLMAAHRVTALHRQLAEARLLDGVLLAARTMEHELGNKLAKTVGWAELLVNAPTLPAEFLTPATEALHGAQEAIALVRQLQRVIRVQETDWGSGAESTIDIPRSSGN